MADAIKIDGLELAGGAAVGQACFSAYLSADQTVPTASTDDVKFDTENYDVRGEFNVGTYSFTAQDAGYYLVHAQVTYKDPAAGILYINVLNGGTSVISSATYVAAASAYVHTVVAHGVIYLDAGDVVKVTTRHTCGVNEDIDSSLDRSRFDISKIASIGITGSPRVHAYKTAGAGDQAIPTGVSTLVTLDAEQYDLFNEFNTATSTFTATEAGYYLLNAQARWNCTVDQARYQMGMYTAGVGAAYAVQSIMSSLAGAKVVWVNAATVYYLEPGDTVCVYAFHDAGVNQNVQTQDGNTFLTISKLDCTGSGGFNSKVSAWRSGALSIPNASDTTLAYDTELFDGKGEFDVATGLFSPSEAGYYMASAQVYYGAAVADQRSAIGFIKNAAWDKMLSQYASTAGQFGQNLSALIYLEPGDTLGVRLWHSFGGAAALIVTDARYNWFTIHRLS